MATREFSVVVGINATKAVVGAGQFKQGADKVNRSNRAMQRSTARTTKRMTAMITTMGRFRGVASLMFAGFLGVGGIGAVIRTISQFETKISQVTALISAQNPRSLGGAMAALTEKARELGATTLFTAGQAAEGMRFLSLAGFTALEVLQAIEPALILATVGMLDLGVAADIVSNIMAAFSVDAADTEDIVNGLAFTASRTNTSIQQLGQAMKFVGPVAGALGLDVKETSVALGILGNSGLQASLAGTSLRRVMSGLLNPSKEARKVFASMGLTQKELVSTMTGEQGLVRLVELLAEKGIDAADAFLLFGQRGAPGLLSLVNQRGKLRELTEGLEEMGDIARKQAKIIQDNLGGDARIAISALSEAIIALGRSGFGDFLRETTQSVTGFFRAMTGILTPADEMTKAMEKGSRAAEFLKDNTDNLRKALFIFVAFMNRQLLVTVATAIGRFLLLGATVAGLAGPFAVASAGSLLLSGALNILKAAIITTGVGALVIGIGLLLNWAFSSDEATASAEDLTKAMKEQRIEAEKLIFTFDLLDETDRALAKGEAIKQLEVQKTRLAEARIEMEQFSSVSAGLVFQQQAVVEAQKALNEELEGTTAFAIAEDNLKRQKEGFIALSDSISKSGFSELKAEINDLEPSILALIVDLEAMRLVSEGLAVNMEAARDQIENAGKESEKAKPSFEDLTGILQDESIAFRELVEEADPMGVALEEVKEKMDLFNKIANLTGKQLEKLKITEEELNAVQKQLNNEMTKAGKILSDSEKTAKKLLDARKKQFEKLQDLRDGTKTVAALTRDYTRDLVDNALAVAANTITVEEFWEAQKILKGILEDNITVLENTCEKTDELKECMDDNSKAMEAIWDQAMRNIQDSFADAFRNIGDGFDDFATGILNAFKDLLANMAAQAAINNIFGAGGGFFSDFVGGLTGGRNSTAGAGSTAGGAVGLAGGIAGIGSAFSGFLGAAAGFIDGFTSLLGFGADLGGSLSIASQGGASAGAGAFAAGGALGALSGGLVDSILGGRGDPGTTLGLSVIGGAIGSIFGPLGAIVGGAIGSFASNLFGGAKKLESATLEFDATAEGFNAVVESVVSKQRSFFRGRRFTTTRIDVDTGTFDDALDAVISRLVATGEALGVDVETALDNFSFSRVIDIKGKSQEQIAALLENLFNDVVVGVINTFINNVEGLSERLKDTVSFFKGNTDEFIRAFELAASIDLAFLVDPVSAVTDALATENRSLTTSYEELLAAYRLVINEFDGSLPALEELAAATNIVVQAQVALVAALITVGDEISTLFQGSAQTIRESLLSEEELFSLRKSQIDALVEQAGITTDPAELSALAEEINRLGLDAFNLLDEDQKRALGSEFIEFFEGLDDLFGDQIAQGLQNVTNDNQALNQEVATSMIDAAAAQVEAANQSRDTFIDWRDFLNEVRAGGGLRFAELQV